MQKIAVDDYVRLDATALAAGVRNGDFTGLSWLRPRWIVWMRSIPRSTLLPSCSMTMPGGARGVPCPVPSRVFPS